MRIRVLPKAGTEDLKRDKYLDQKNRNLFLTLCFVLDGVTTFKCWYEQTCTIKGGCLLNQYRQSRSNIMVVASLP
ncbi:unnamed protein product [Allacma fusca]|uniref:Uncharacterized protein n=1 Tax=Allacma fusca TaxID=39272 RepID=A0A8J2J609_9HEXA|nr:unnamed protein product [Allacma fusca]